MVPSIPLSEGPRPQENTSTLMIHMQTLQHGRLESDLFSCDAITNAFASLALELIIYPQKWLDSSSLSHISSLPQCPHDWLRE